MEPRLLQPGEALPDWVRNLDIRTFGDAWGGLLERELLWIVPELAFARWMAVPGTEEAELLRIAVSTEVRRQGLGRELLAVCEKELADRGVRTLFLEVRDSNAAARGLYRRQRWEEFSFRPRYYADGEDAVLFRKQLRNSS